MKITIESRFIMAGVDVKQGDIVRFVSEGKLIDDQWNEGKKKLQIDIRGERFSGEKLLTLNNSSKREMIKLYGDDTIGWVGKEAQVNVVKQMVRGELRDVVILSAPASIVEKEDGGIKIEQIPF